MKTRERRAVARLRTVTAPPCRFLVACVAIIGIVSSGVRAHAQVSGDCNGDGAVTVDELLDGLTVKRGLVPPTVCPLWSNDVDAASLDDNTALRSALTGEPPRGRSLPNSSVAAPVAPVVIEIGSATGLPGQQVTFDVTVRTNGQQVAGMQNDTAFDPSTAVAATLGGSPDCTPASVLNFGGFAFHGPSSIRAVLLSLSLTTVPDGAVLYRCKVNIAAVAPFGSYPLQCSNVIVSDPTGSRLLSTCTNGAIAVGSVCGNGVLESGEQCDDGNLMDGDGCDSNCTVTACGNGIVTSGEQCDDGNTSPGDGCDATCVAETGWTCLVPAQPCQPICGDGLVRGNEQCDDGNLADGDGCDSSCTLTACGNGILTSGEQCDDGNTISGDGCDANCQVECHDTCVLGAPLVPGCNACVASICTADPYCCAVFWDEICIGETTSICGIPCLVCGNGVREAGEQCDDGNTVSGDGCDADCTFTGCGNGIVTSGEQCDDGNTVPGDGCDASCQLECHDTCVSGAPLAAVCNACVASICAANPSCCDVSWDETCVSDTTSICGIPCPVCGNGVLEFGEQCDDGNTVAGDGCDANCTFTDGFTSPFTQCPPIGPGTGCGVLLEVTPAGAVIVLVDTTQVSYDGDDTVVGVHNSSNRPIAQIALSSSSVPIFDLDGDGLCTPLGAPVGCPFGPTGYEGPGVFFSIHGQSAGIVYFAPAVQPGGIAYFSLEEKISWGQLAAQLNPEKPFQCYGGRILAAQPPIAPVSVADAVTSFTAHVRGLRDLCTPTNEDGENPAGVSNPDHLESYALAPEKPKQLRQVLPVRNQIVANQFGLLLLDMHRPTRLLVPTAKSLTGPPPAPVSPAVDHFTCYKVKRSKGALAFTPLSNVRLADQFGAATVTVGTPTRLCLPANKNNETPGAETHSDRLLCYRVSGGVSGIGRVFTNNQFGSGVIYPRARHELCVPSVMVAQ